MEKNIAEPFNPNGYDVTLNVKDNSPFSLLPSPLIKREILQKIFKSISPNSLSYETTCQILLLTQEKSQIGKKERKKHLDKNTVCIKVGDYLIFKNLIRNSLNNGSNNDHNDFGTNNAMTKNIHEITLDSITEKDVENNVEYETDIQSSERNTLGEKESRSEDNKWTDLRSIKLNNIEVLFQKVCNTST